MNSSINSIDPSVSLHADSLIQKLTHNVTISENIGEETIFVVGPKYNVTFSEYGLPNINWYVNVSGQASSGAITGSSYTDSLTNGSYSYSIATVNKTYSATGGPLIVSGQNLSVSVLFNRVLYNQTFAETGLPLGIMWYLNISGQHTLSSSTSTITTALINGSYNYTAATVDKKYSAKQRALLVNGSNATHTVTFTSVTYLITFIATSFPTNSTWYVNLSDGLSNSSTTSKITFKLQNGSYTYKVAISNKIYAPYDYGRVLSFTVQGSNLTLSNFQFFPVDYLVSFNEYGLPNGTAWFLNLTNLSVSGPITKTSSRYVLHNGTYRYTVSTLDKNYRAKGGSFIVNGGSDIVNVTFVPVEYEVTFTENGLPAGTDWNVTFNGVTKNTTGTELSFIVMNGSYGFSLGNISGFSEKLNSSTVRVSGHNINETIQFTANKGGLPSKLFWEIIVGAVVGLITFAAVFGLQRKRR